MKTSTGIILKTQINTSLSKWKFKDQFDLEKTVILLSTNFNAMFS